jgi:hypothetical protein
LPPVSLMLHRNIDAVRADHEACRDECGHAAGE